jgi:hypothetical protein
MSDDEDQMLRLERHRYGEPEPKGTRFDRDVVYAVLGLVVVVLAILVATGAVPIG